MTPNEFLATIKPAARRSQLEPHRKSLLLLREAGCSLKQLQEFLRIHAVEVTTTTIGRFLANSDSDGAEEPLAPASAPAVAASPQVPSQTPAPSAPVPAPAPRAIPAKFVPPTDPIDAMAFARERLGDKPITPGSTDP